MLPQTSTKIVTDPTKYLHLIHGDVGTGKSSWLAQIPGHLIMITEAGLEGLEHFGEPILRWEDFMLKCKEVIAGKAEGWKDQREVKAICVDTYDNLFWLAAAHICRTQLFKEKGVALRYDRIEDVPYGKGYSRTSQLVISCLNELRLKGFGIFCTSHTKERNVTWRGQDFTGLGPNLPPSASNAILQVCSCIGYFSIEITSERRRTEEETTIEITAEKYTQRWQPTFLVKAKHRLEGFPSVLPLEIHTGYETYLEAFNKTVENLPGTKTEEQE